MPEADVTYADVKFTRPKTNETPSSDDTTYSEVKILTSEPPACVNCSQQQTGSNRNSQVTSERAAVLVLSILLVTAVVTLGVTVFNKTPEDCKQLNETVQALKEEIEALRKNLSAQTTCPLPSTSPPPDGLCLRCAAGWEIYGGKCYYFTTTKSSWSDSRAGCEGKGGDLVKINSREEQIFLEAKVRDKMDDDEDKFWIGLTDSEVEGTWLWVDRSNLSSCLSFWRKTDKAKEPDDWKGENNEYPDGEDCVRMGVEGQTAELNCWFDQSCKKPNKSICEKEAETISC